MDTEVQHGLREALGQILCVNMNDGGFNRMNSFSRWFSVVSAHSVNVSQTIHPTEHEAIIKTF